MMRKPRVMVAVGLALVIVAATVGAFVATNSGSAPPVIRAAVYYPWFPGAWTQQGITPYTNYDPSAGFYSSNNPAVVKQQIAAMQYGHLNAGLVSWWGQGSREDSVMPTDLAAASGTGFKWAVYYEPQGRTEAQVASDLAYIHTRYAADPSYLAIGGKPVIFDYTSASCSDSAAWHQANTEGFYTVLRVFGGYQTCPDQPDNWHQYSPGVAVDHQQGHSFVISPGFNKVGESAPRLPRNVNTWATDVAAMVASNEPIQLVTTFNEWGEGTAVESATQWASASGYGQYLDVMHAEIPTDTTASTFTGNATSGTYVLGSSPKSNYNGTSLLAASHVSYRTLLAFTTNIPAGSVIQSASLTITPAIFGNGNFEVHNEGAFDPAKVTWANQPKWQPAIIGTTKPPVVAGQAQAIPLAGLVGSGTVTLGVDYSSPGVIAKLYGVVGPAPILSVTYTGPGTATTTTTGASTTTTTNGGTTTTTGATTTTTAPSTTTTTNPSTTTTTTGSTTGHKVVIIPEENHSLAQTVSSMPYMTGLGNTFGHATAFAAITHPSLPNYLALWGGSTYGTSSDCSVGCGPTAPGDRSVWDQTIAAGKSAKAYQQSMGGNCQTGGGGAYAPRHGPWPYWTNATSRANCSADDVPLTGLQADISAGHLPITGEITPDLNNDWHDGTAAQADAFLKSWVPALMAGPDYTSGNLTIVITMDENDGSSGNIIPLIVIDPRLSNVVVTTPGTLYSLTQWLESNAGVPFMGAAAGAPNMKAAFGL